ncbi:GGDEF domain-containing protein [Paractinoplanes toevensis]|uniref:GGDEF domain-containing protein n=1 Tax=Paractinoplanes toevensis TaxID=571911 RepID=UPI001BB36F3C|nr:GGDEF domain-containing protein [Actinoplanes toevensis]
MIFLALILVRSAGAPGQRGARWGSAPPWLAAGLITFLAGDLVWLFVGDHPVSGWLSRGIDSLYFAAFVILGYAVRHAAATDEQRATALPRPPGIPLMSMLLLALLMAPAVMVMQMSHGAFQHGAAIATGSTIMSVLVVTRLTVLLRFVARQTEQVRELARRAELTGLSNRRAWTDELPRVLEQARQTGLPVSVCMVDLDRFKIFNDTHGHQAGDRLLKEAAAAWLSQLRRSDILARYGGEEFIVLLPDTALDAACTIMERLRPVTPAAQTFSSGVAVWDTTETSEELIADAVLYQAKHTGRDRIVAAASRPTPPSSSPDRSPLPPPVVPFVQRRQPGPEHVGQRRIVRAVRRFPGLGEDLPAAGPGGGRRAGRDQHRLRAPAAVLRAGRGGVQRGLRAVHEQVPAGHDPVAVERGERVPAGAADRAGQRGRQTCWVSVVSGCRFTVASLTNLPVLALRLTSRSSLLSVPTCSVVVVLGSRSTVLSLTNCPLRALRLTSCSLSAMRS